MSVVIHVGQCGVQLGEAFWPLLEADAASFSRRPNGQIPQCIAVDSEPKVVRRFALTKQTEHVFFDQNGRANNWSMGYHFSRAAAKGKSKTPTPTVFGKDPPRDLNELVLDSLRKAIEMTDGFQGILLMHSLGGGTGSGLGCRLLEEMRDMYPTVFLGTASVAPSLQVDCTALQRYNAVLSLAKVVECVDFVLYKQNDELFHRATHVAKARERESSKSDQKRVTLEDMNRLAACELAGLLLPVDSASSFRFSAIAQDLCPLPAAKIVDTRTLVLAKPKSCIFPAILKSPTSDPSPATVARKLCLQTLQSFQRVVHQQDFNLATQLILRGFGREDQLCVDLIQLMDKTLPCVAWNQRRSWQQLPLYSTSQKPFSRLGGLASTTIGANNGSFLSQVEHLVDRAESQFQSNAFVHWYNKFGTEHDDFVDAFDVCHGLIDGYRELLR